MSGAGVPAAAAAAHGAGGLRAFGLAWSGQTVSLLGSEMAEFAIGLWIYRQTGSMTMFGVVLASMSLPFVLASLPAGALVDRIGARRTLLVSEFGAAASTALLAGLAMSGWLTLAPLLALMAVGAVLKALRMPAFAVLITELVPPPQRSRANGMSQAAQAVGMLAAPALASLALSRYPLHAVLVADLLSFVIGAFLLLAAAPATGEVTNTHAACRTLRQCDWAQGARYLAGQPGLGIVLAYLAMITLAFGAVQATLTPLLLNLASTATLVNVLTLAGFAMLGGSLAAAALRSPQRPVQAILVLGTLQGTALLAGGLHPSVMLIAVGAAGYMAAHPCLLAISQTVWQNIVPPPLQGRVFALRFMAMRSMLPLAFLTAGPLVEHVLTPLAGGEMDRGMGLLLAFSGCSLLLASAAASRSQALWALEGLSRQGSVTER